MYCTKIKGTLFFSTILRKQQFFVLNVRHYTVTIIAKISHPRFSFQLCQVKFQTIFIFMAHTEKQLLTGYKPHKPFLQKGYTDDIFLCVDVWTIPETESNNFIEFSKFMHELHEFRTASNWFDDRFELHQTCLLVSFIYLNSFINFSRVLHSNKINSCWSNLNFGTKRLTRQAKYF